MKKLLPLLIILIFGAAGAGAGFFLRPPPPEPTPEELEAIAAAKKAEEEEKAKANQAFVKLNNQFVIPIVRGERVSSLIVMSITLQTDTDSTEMIYQREPKIRDTFLSVLFDHAYSGGFDGAFNASPKLDVLRKSLVEAVASVTDGKVTDVLITDMARQDG